MFSETRQNATATLLVTSEARSNLAPSAARILRIGRLFTLIS